MDRKKSWKNQVKGWIPKEPALKNNQAVTLFNRLNSFQFVRLFYGVMLGALLFVPFGSYHSYGPPSIYGVLWGYYLPVGYVALALGILAILMRRKLARDYFGVLMVLIGAALLLSLFLYPKQYSVNLIHGTNVAVDIDYPVGNAVTLFMGIISIIAGLTSKISVHFPKKNRPTAKL